MSNDLQSNDVLPDEAYNTTSARFLAWLKTNGAFVSPKIALSDLRQKCSGRGVLARSSIATDEVLFHIPHCCILSYESSKLIPDSVRPLLPTNPWHRLILAMIAEQYAPTKKGETEQTSFWAPYLDLLPANFDTLMYWEEDELRQLEGSAVLEKIGKKHADEAFAQELLPCIRKFPEVFGGPVPSMADDAVVAICHRMASIIMSYAFDLEASTDPPRASESHNDDASGWEAASDQGSDQEHDHTPKALIPLADMLNANGRAHNNARLFLPSSSSKSEENGNELDGDSVVMRALRPISAGEEVFNDYGMLPRADVLRRYGYTTDSYAENDVVELSLNLIADVARESEYKSPSQQNEVEESFDLDARLDYLSNQGYLADGYDISRPSNTGIGAEGADLDQDQEPQPQFPPTLLALLHTLTMPAPEFVKLRQKEKQPKPLQTPPANRLLYFVLVQRATVYPEQAVAMELVPTSPEYERKVRRARMAKEVIEGEKEVLRLAAETISAAILQSDVPGELGEKRKASDIEMTSFEADVATARHSQGIKKRKGTQ